MCTSCNMKKRLNTGWGHEEVIYFYKTQVIKWHTLYMIIFYLYIPIFPIFGPSSFNPQNSVCMIQFGLASLMITSSRDESIGVVSGYPGTVVMAPGCESSAFQSCRQSWNTCNPDTANWDLWNFFFWTILATFTISYFDQDRTWLWWINHHKFSAAQLVSAYRYC